MNKYQRAGAKGGRVKASDLQKAMARKTIFLTKPWNKREYVVLLVLSRFPDKIAIEALYLEHGFKALVTVSVSSHGYLVMVTVTQRKDFSLNDVERIIQILEDFKNG